MNVRKIFSAACLSLLFMNGQAAEPASHQGKAPNTSPKEYLEDWKEGYMDIHQISTGRGNAAFLIFPDGTTMLLDAGDQGDISHFEWEIMPSVPNTSKTPAEWIARYIKHFSKPLKNDGHLDYAFITHFDCDHIGTDDTLAISKPGLNYKLQGITHVDYLLNISTLIDRGYPKYDNPSVEAIERTHRYLPNYKRFIASRTALGKRNEMVKVGSSTQIRMLKNPAKFTNFKVRNIVGNGEIWTGTGEQSEKFDLPKFKENDWSAGVRISYGKFDWFSAGDIFSEKFEEAVARISGETDVVVCNHHGYSDAMHQGFVKLMAPQAFVVPTWDLYHPQPNTLANMLNTKLYPGKREVYAAGMVESNRKRLGENGKKIKPDGHVVIRVYNNGDTFQFFVLNDRSTDYEIIYKSDIKKSLSSDKDITMYQYIDGLMQQMTLEEKIGQLNLPCSDEITTGQTISQNIEEKIRNGQVSGLYNIKGVEKIREMQRIAVEESRLKIPLIFAMDVIHGYETVFPIPLGMAATWNLNTIEQSARIAATEASADGICWTFSPMVDISRDPRWGRVAEGGGEDPFLGGEIAKAMVYGYQGRGDSIFPENNNIMACVKHYALYGAAEGGLDYNTTDMSRIRMFNEYMYPYQAAVEAGAGSVMASFNEIDGIPATANKWLLTDVLRNQWGFKGFIVTDYTGIQEMVDHGIGNLEEVSARAMDAGVDLDMVSEGFLSNIKQSIEKGRTTEQQVNQACRRILEAKYKLGLFDNPYRYCDTKRAQTEIYTEKNRNIARKAAAESFVLLKNDNRLLPLRKKSRIAVIGPLANTRSNMPGTWSVAVNLEAPATLVEGLQKVVGQEGEIIYAKGSHLMSDSAYENRATTFGRTLHRNQEKRSEEQMLAEALHAARSSDVVIAALGEASEMNGESSSRTDLDIPDAQKRLLKELLKTGKPVVLVLFTGRPLTLKWENEHVPAILNVWFGGTEAAYAIGDVLFGDAAPEGKLPVTFPQNVGQIPLYYNRKNTGRPLAAGQWFEKFRTNYIDVTNEPLYPFGYGLTYTQFEYSDIRLDSNRINHNETLTASVTVTNVGDRDGSEVVQLYIRDLVGSITRPVKELKGFKKVKIAKGESAQISFKITPEMLKFYNSELQWVNEPGDFEIMIGTNSRDVKKALFTMQP